MVTFMRGATWRFSPDAESAGSRIMTSAISRLPLGLRHHRTTSTGSASLTVLRLEPESLHNNVGEVGERRLDHCLVDLRPRRARVQSAE